MDFGNLSKILLNMVYQRAQVSDVLNTAEELVGNPMAVGRIDLDIKYVSSGMPEDSLISRTGSMKGAEKQTVHEQMSTVEDDDEPVILRKKESFKEDKYEALLTPIRIHGNRTGYLSILAVNRPHEEADLQSAKIITKSLKLLFELNNDEDFCGAGGINAILKQMINQGDVKPEELKLLKDLFKKQKRGFCVYSIAYRNRSKANAISRDARAEICRLLDTDLYVSEEGILRVISFCNVEPVRDAFFDLLETYYLYAGVGYRNKGDVYTLYDSAGQADIALSLADETHPLVFMEERMHAFILQKGRSEHSFNDMVHPAAFMLMEYDSEHGTQLCRTVMSYLENKQSIKATAIELNVHVNTVNQRLAQVEKLLSGYKFCSASLFDLYLSLIRHTE